ncbi:5264_t:CDS:2, partial [Acaulospora colombiana]
GWGAGDWEIAGGEMCSSPVPTLFNSPITCLRIPGERDGEAGGVDKAPPHIAPSHHNQWSCPGENRNFILAQSHISSTRLPMNIDWWLNSWEEARSVGDGKIMGDDPLGIRPPSDQDYAAIGYDILVADEVSTDEET